MTYSVFVDWFWLILWRWVKSGSLMAVFLRPWTSSAKLVIHTHLYIVVFFILKLHKSADSARLCCMSFSLISRLSFLWCSELLCSFRIPFSGAYLTQTPLLRTLCFHLSFTDGYLGWQNIVNLCICRGRWSTSDITHKPTRHITSTLYSDNSSQPKFTTSQPPSI